MKKMKNKIILASSSPRRKELFDKYGIDYTVDFVETEEVLDESLTLFKRLENIALQKAKPLQQYVSLKINKAQHLQMQQLLHLKNYLIKKLKIILIQMNGKAKRVLMQSKELLQSL